MKYKRRYLQVLLFIIAVVLVTACTGGNETNNKSLKKIGVLQIVEHGSLDAAREGFLSELARLGYVDGENIKVTYLNAQGDQANLKSMSEKLAKKSDLIYAIATPSVQSVMNETEEVPIIFAAVSDPIESGLVQTLEKPGKNVTGVTDTNDVKQQISLIQKINPATKKVGLIYNPGEANSAAQILQAESMLQTIGLETAKTTVNTTNDIQSAMESLAKQVDAIYIPTDNTMASGMTTVGEVAKAYNIPVIPGSGEMVMAGGLATYGVDYAQTGGQAAHIAQEILSEGASPREIPVGFPKELSLVINEEMATSLGIDTSKLEDKQV